MKTTEDFAKELLTRWGLILEGEYSGAAKPVTFRCSAGHLNSATATNVLQRGYKCKQCITGHVTVSKIKWDSDIISNVTKALEYKTTEEVAKLYNTTVSAINNMLSKHNISNPRNRLQELKLSSKLLEQQRELISFLGDMATIRCSKGHIHVQEISNIISHNTQCPSCFSLGTSKVEKEVQDYISSIYANWIILKDRTILQGKELDIVLPDIGLAIEINGTYWHREEKVGKEYHITKTNNVESFGYQLLHIKDYDWISKQNIVKSMLNSKLGITNKIYARKCILKKINFPKEFLQNNHIQGAGQPTSNNYGLFYKEELVAVATYSKPRFSNEADLELVRFCSKLNTTVVGGLSKLLLRNFSILSYANRDYSNGNAYLATGFELIRHTAPGLEYYYKDEKLSRYKAQSMSTEELNKYNKYYNSGNLVFICTNKVM